MSIESENMKKREMTGNLIHRLDPRAKLLSLVGLLVAVVLSNPPSVIPQFNPSTFFPYLFVILLLLSLATISKISLITLLKRSMVVIPFSIVVALFLPFFGNGDVVVDLVFGSLTLSSHGINTFVGVVVKSYVCVMCVILLTMTTPFPSIIKALGWLRVPETYLQVLSFLYRYMFILMEEVTNMKRARDSRNPNRVRRMWYIKTAGLIAGTLFIRAYERGERVYSAMVSRGYEGRMPSLGRMKMGMKDWIFMCMFITVSAYILV
jgi:cobalt/nickel transport system permease protein